MAQRGKRDNALAARPEHDTPQAHFAVGHSVNHVAVEMVGLATKSSSGVGHRRHQHARHKRGLLDAAAEHVQVKRVSVGNARVSSLAVRDTATTAGSVQIRGAGAKYDKTNKGNRYQGIAKQARHKLAPARRDMVNTRVQSGTHTHHPLHIRASTVAKAPAVRMHHVGQAAQPLNPADGPTYGSVCSSRAPGTKANTCFPKSTAMPVADPNSLAKGSSATARDVMPEEALQYELQDSVEGSTWDSR